MHIKRYISKDIIIKRYKNKHIELYKAIGIYKDIYKEKNI